MARRKSESGFYHVRIRGNGKQILFENNGDRRAFLEMARRRFADAKISVIAWCLMDNHVHLIVRDERGALSDTMRALASAYARRYNARTGHEGHVFMGRFQSSPIEDEAYLLEAVRYVHNNPEAAGVCAAKEYPWSSYHEYAEGGPGGLSDPSLVLEMLGGPQGFEAFCSEGKEPEYRFEAGVRVEDADARGVAADALGDVAPAEVKGLARARRDQCLQILREAGLSARQIARLTGIGERTVYRVTR